MPLKSNYSNVLRRISGFSAERISSPQSLLTQHLRWIGLALKLLITAAVVWYIYERVISAEVNLSLSTVFHQQIRTVQSWGTIIFASLCLMVINWSIEVFKWKLLMDTQIKIRWKTSIKGVLSGISFGIFSPNRSGEFIGRVLALHPKVRVKGALLSFVNGIAQTTATFTFGVFGLLFLLYTLGTNSIGQVGTLVLQCTLLLTLGLLMLVYFKLGMLSQSLMKLPWLKRWKEQIAVFEEIPMPVLHRIYQLSLFRFLTFLGQYLLLFYLFFGEQNWGGLIGASVLTLFSTTLLPFVPVPDLLLRETFALSFFQLFAFDAVHVSIVVFAVWLINVAFPAIIGATALFTYRIFRRAA